MAHDITSFWNIFDAVHLSGNKSEVVRKLLFGIKHKPISNMDSLYAKSENEVRTEGNYGDVLCDLISEGEFDFIGKLIRRSK